VGYVGGRTKYTTIPEPGTWVLAYYREWVRGDPHATLPDAVRASLLSLYNSTAELG